MQGIAYLVEAIASGSYADALILRVIDMTNFCLTAVKPDLTSMLPKIMEHTVSSRGGIHPAA